MRPTNCQRLHVDVTVVPGRGDAGTRTRRALLLLITTRTFDVLLGGERSQPRNTREVGYKDIPSDTNFSCRIYRHYLHSSLARPSYTTCDFHPRSRSGSKKQITTISHRFPISHVYDTVSRCGRYKGDCSAVSSGWFSTPTITSDKYV
jgi:hypothetical protein